MKNAGNTDIAKMFPAFARICEADSSQRQEDAEIRIAFVFFISDIIMFLDFVEKEEK